MPGSADVNHARPMVFGRARAWLWFQGHVANTHTLRWLLQPQGWVAGGAWWPPRKGDERGICLQTPIKSGVKMTIFDDYSPSPFTFIIRIIMTMRDGLG